MPNVKKADEKADFRQLIDETGNSSNFSKENTDMLKEMYIGKRNAPASKVAKSGDKSYSFGEGLDDKPELALNPTVTDEGTDADVTEKEMIDGFELENDNFKKNEERFKDLTNVAKAKGDKARAANALQVAKIANAKNLAQTLFKKGLIARQDIPAYVKDIAATDNAGYALLRKLADNAQAQTQRKATASTKEAGLNQAVHLSKPMPSGRNALNAFADLEWSGVPR